MYVVAALFIALGLDPVVRWLERHGLKRGLGIGVVFAGFILIIGGILAIVIPMIANQIAQLVSSAPEIVRNLTSEQWYKDVNERFGEFIDFGALLKMGQDFIGTPSELGLGSRRRLAGGHRHRERAHRDAHRAHPLAVLPRRRCARSSAASTRSCRAQAARR